MVTLYEPVSGRLNRCTYVSAGLSYEKLVILVPTKPAMVKTVVCPCAKPGLREHFTLVAEVHVAVKHTDVPTVTEGVRSDTTKLVPTRVMLLVPDDAPLGLRSVLITGESYVKTANAVPINNPPPLLTPA
jgi:hypothetical protein